MPIRVFDSQEDRDRSRRVFFMGQHRIEYDQYTQEAASAGEPWTSNWQHLNDKFDYCLVFDSRWKNNNRDVDYSRGLVYKDAYAIKTNHDDYATQQAYILKDHATNTQNVYLDFGSPPDQFAADIGDPNFRANWIANAQARFNATEYAGLYIDDVNIGKNTTGEWQISDINNNFIEARNPRTGLAYTRDEWRADMATFMEEIRAAFPDKLIAHNIVFYAQDMLTDENARRIIRASDWQHMERGVSDLGLTGDYGSTVFRVRSYFDFIDYVHRLGRSVIQSGYGQIHLDENLIDYEIAGYYLVRENFDMYSQRYIEWIKPDGWRQEFETTLGQALGPRYDDPVSGLIRRDFSDGIALLNLPGEDPKTFTFRNTTYLVEAKRGLIVLY